MASSHLEAMTSLRCGLAYYTNFHIILSKRFGHLSVFSIINWWRNKTEMTARDCLTGKNAPKMFGPAINVRHFRPNASDRRTSEKKSAKKINMLQKIGQTFIARKKLTGAFKILKCAFGCTLDERRNFNPRWKAKFFNWIFKVWRRFNEDSHTHQSSVKWRQQHLGEKGIKRKESFNGKCHCFCCGYFGSSGNSCYVKSHNRYPKPSLILI